MVHFWRVTLGQISRALKAKDRMALSRGDYHWQHEPCLVCRLRDGANGHRTDDRTQTTLWTIPARDDSGHGHGTQKPVECMRRPMQNHEVSDVYDPFCGSGTTIIAAEQLGRRCFAIEIEPRYVQVAIDRWEAFTQSKAVKVGEASVRKPWTCGHYYDHTHTWRWTAVLCQRLRAGRWWR